MLRQHELVAQETEKQNGIVSSPPNPNYQLQKPDQSVSCASLQKKTRQSLVRPLRKGASFYDIRIRRGRCRGKADCVNFIVKRGQREMGGLNLFADADVIYGKARRRREHCAPPLPFSFTLKGPENLVREIRTMRRKRWRRRWRRRRRWEKQRTNERKSERTNEGLKLAFRSSSLACKKADREGVRIK